MQLIATGAALALGAAMITMASPSSFDKPIPTTPPPITVKSPSPVVAAPEKAPSVFDGLMERLKSATSEPNQKELSSYQISPSEFEEATPTEQ